MSGSLDMSLDDLIRNNRGRSEGHFRYSARKPRGSGPGPDRRGFVRDPVRLNPYPVRPQPPMPMPMPMQMQRQLVPAGGSDMESKLYVSNLDYGVTNEDIKVLFSEVGELKRYSINYDRSGRSKGTADVVFYRQADALAAIKRYNNVQLDGKPLIIELVGAHVVMSAPVQPIKTGILRRPNVAPIRDIERVGGRGLIRNGGDRSNVAGHGFGRGHGRLRNTGPKLSVEDLDADLERYRSEATRMK